MGRSRQQMNYRAGQKLACRWGAPCTLAKGSPSPAIALLCRPEPLISRRSTHQTSIGLISASQGRERGTAPRAAALLLSLAPPLLAARAQACPPPSGAPQGPPWRWRWPFWQVRGHGRAWEMAGQPWARWPSLPAPAAAAEAWRRPRSGAACSPPSAALCRRPMQACAGAPPPTSPAQAALATLCCLETMGWCCPTLKTWVSIGGGGSMGWTRQGARGRRRGGHQRHSAERRRLPARPSPSARLAVLPRAHRCPYPSYLTANASGSSPAMPRLRPGRPGVVAHPMLPSICVWPAFALLPAQPPTP